VLRVAAGGDLHCGGGRDLAELAEALAAAGGQADLVLLAGDLTERGEPEQAAALAEACRAVPVPVLAVLGNHDRFAGRAPEVAATLEAAGVAVLQGEHRVVRAAGVEVGVVGTSGGPGGFPGAPLRVRWRDRRRVREHDAREQRALDRGLRAVAGCAVRIVLLHFAPTTSTLVGERRHLWPLLGSDRLARPILRHRPDLVVHAHVHHGRPAGELGPVPVLNVSAPLLGRPLALLRVGARARP
jgi:Icc-related predicted phosphoesterase